MGKVNTMSVVKVLQKQKLLSFSLLLFTLSIGILIGTLLTHGVSAQKGTGAPDATPLTIPDPVQLSNAFSQLAKKLEPSVVNITSTALPKQAPAAGNRRRQQQVVPQDPGDEQGFDLFRFFQGPFGDSPQSQQRREGTGSGVIVDPNGYILTNNHVVDGADRLRVHLTGDPAGTDYDAKLIGVDIETDLAVIKIDAPQKLPAARMGNSDAVQVGDWAVAIGSPFGLEATVTAGIISAKERQIQGGQQFQHFLQTDAAINPGNSGGPLLNIKGEVIGINTAIATTSASYQGVGFALPINTAVTTYNQLIKSGKVVRGSIGVSLDPQAKPELLKVYGASQGAFVSAVRQGSPAADAGVKEGDVIVSLNGKPITKSDDLVNAVAETQVGSKATLGLVRDGKRTDVPVMIGDRAQIYADNPLVAGPRPGGSARGESSESMFGIYVKDLEPADIENSGYPEKGGVLVTRVDPTSFADDIGLAPNDVVTEINRQPVKTVADLQRIQATLKPGVSVAFRALRPAGGLGARGRTPSWQPIFPAGTLPRK